MEVKGEGLSDVAMSVLLQDLKIITNKTRAKTLGSQALEMEVSTQENRFEERRKDKSRGSEQSRGHGSLWGELETGKEHAWKPSSLPKVFYL